MKKVFLAAFIFMQYNFAWGNPPKFLQKILNYFHGNSQKCSGEYSHETGTKFLISAPTGNDKYLNNVGSGLAIGWQSDNPFFEFIEKEFVKIEGDPERNIGDIEMMKNVFTQNMWIMLTGKNSSRYSDVNKCPDDYQEIYIGNQRNPIRFCSEYPATNISYAEAKTILEGLNKESIALAKKKKDKKVYIYRLATNDEWQYVAEGGKKGDDHASKIDSLRPITLQEMEMNNPFKVNSRVDRNGNKIGTNSLGIEIGGMGVYEWVTNTHSVKNIEDAPYYAQVVPPQAGSQEYVLRGQIGFSGENFLNYRFYADPWTESVCVGLRFVRTLEDLP